MKKQWKLIGMWALLDLVLLLLLYTLFPVAVGIQAISGVFQYAHMFIIAIAFLLVIATFLAFHRGCMINLSHHLIKTPDQWWHWIVFHWGLAIITIVAVALVSLALGPIFATPSIWRFLGVAIAVCFFFWLLHLISLSQYYFLKYKKTLKAVHMAWQKQWHKKLKNNLLDILKYEGLILLGFLTIEALLSLLLNADLYYRIDIILIPAYYIAAITTFYAVSMRNRLHLFG